MNQQAMMKLRKLQKEMAEAQKRLEETSFVGSAGGNMVKITMLGNHQVVKVEIATDAVEDKEDIEMLEDTIVTAFNDALKKIDQETTRVMGPYTAGLPGGFF